MAMIYTLVTSAQEWLSERFGQDANIENDEAEVAAKDDVWAFSNFFSFLSPLFYFSFVSYILCVYVVSVSKHFLAKYTCKISKAYELIDCKILVVLVVRILLSVHKQRMFDWSFFLVILCLLS